MPTKTETEPKMQPVETEQIAPETTPEPLNVTEVATPLAWFTLEVGLYALIFMVGLGLRLWRLGAYPLSDVEAQQSLIAWRLYQGAEILPPVVYSPLLVSLNTLSFFLFGDSEASARLGSLLLGSGLLILPLTLRRQLGSLVCLLAAAALAISPTALYLSRTVNGEIGVATGALMVVSGFLNWSEDGQQRWLLWLGGGLALMLVSGGMAYTMVVVFAVVIIIGLTSFKKRWAQGVAFAASKESASPQPLKETTLRGSTSEESAYVIPNPNLPAPATENHQGKDKTKTVNDDLVRTQLRNAAIFSVALLAVLATTALFNLSGFSILTVAVGDWLGRFSFAPRIEAGFNAVFLLTIYEPLLVFSGLAGLALVMMRGNFAAAIFAGWFVAALVLDVPMGGRPTSSLMLVVVPLAFLAAFALAELWQRVRDDGSWSNEGILLAAGLTIFSFAYIGLTGWLDRICGADDLACQYAWLQALAALILFMVIIVFFALISDFNVALRGAALVGVVVGLLVLVNISWRLNYGPLAQQAYQPLAGIPASPELVLLADTLREQSARRVGDETLLDITLTGLFSPALEWQLRNYNHLSRGNLSPSTAIITPANTELAIEGAYLGQDFALDALWSPVGLQTKELFEWLIYRYLENPTTPPQSNRAVLWLRLEQ